MDVYAFMRGNRDYFEDFISRMTYHSNAIEGSTLTLPETYAILWNDDSMVISATPRELYDAINHKYALEAAMAEEGEGLSEATVKKVGGLVNGNINEISGYRRVQVMIRGAEHVPPAPQAVAQQMMELVYAYNCDVRTGRDPYEREAEFHIRFERIHPFEDGNGRTGRILLCRGLMCSGVAPAVVPKDRRAEYFGTIEAMDVAALCSLIRETSLAEARRIAAFRAQGEGMAVPPRREGPSLR